MIYVERNDVAAATRLLRHVEGHIVGSRRSGTPGLTLLHAADGKPAFVRLALGRGDDPNAYVGGWTPLHSIANKHESKDVIESARLLLAAHADPNRTWLDNGWTSLHVAANRGNASLMRLLIANGGRIGQKDSRGQVPIHLAALQGHGEVLRVLLRAGADPSAKDARGWTPLYDLRRYRKLTLERLPRYVRKYDEAEAILVDAVRRQRRELHR